MHSVEVNKLLQKIAVGDEASFRSLYDLFKVPYYRAAFKMTQSTHVAEEIVQEVFVTIWTKRGIISEAKDASAYMHTILQNVIYQYFRDIARSRRSHIYSIYNHEMVEEEIESKIIEKENKLIHENIINRLSNQQRLIYRMAKQEGMTRDEISQNLNLSPNTVKNHLSAAIKYIKEAYSSVKSLLALLLI